MKSFAFASTLPASFLAEMSGAALAVRYGWYFLLVALGLFFIALTGRRAARGATREVVLEKCRALVKALDGARAAPEKKKILVPCFRRCRLLVRAWRLPYFIMGS